MVAVAHEDPTDARRQRAKERRERITIVRVGRDQLDPDEPRIHGEAGIELAARLTRMAWELSGLPLPTYSRENTPYVFVPHSERK